MARVITAARSTRGKRHGRLLLHRLLHQEPDGSWTWRVRGAKVPATRTTDVCLPIEPTARSRQPRGCGFLEAVTTPLRPPPSLAPYLYWRKRKQTIIDKMASEGLPLTVIIQEAARNMAVTRVPVPPSCFAGPVNVPASTWRTLRSACRNSRPGSGTKDSRR